MSLKEEQRQETLVILEALIRAYYEFNCTGGSLHIVLDDDNISRDSIEWCLKQENCDYWGRVIGEALLQLNIWDRFEVIHHYVDPGAEGEIPFYYREDSENCRVAKEMLATPRPTNWLKEKL